MYLYTVKSISIKAFKGFNISPCCYLRRLCFHRFFSVHGGLHRRGDSASRGSASRAGLHLGMSATRGVSIGGGAGRCASRGVCIQGVWEPPPRNRILQDTVNERAVCILLECILVWNIDTISRLHINRIKSWFYKVQKLIGCETFSTFLC